MASRARASIASAVARSTLRAESRSSRAHSQPTNANPSMKNTLTATVPSASGDGVPARVTCSRMPSTYAPATATVPAAATPNWTNTVARMIEPIAEGTAHSCQPLAQEATHICGTASSHIAASDRSASTQGRETRRRYSSTVNSTVAQMTADRWLPTISDVERKSSSPPDSSTGRPTESWSARSAPVAWSRSSSARARAPWDVVAAGSTCQMSHMEPRPR